MRPALSSTSSPNELMRRCLLRWQSERPASALRPLFRHLPHFSFNPRFLRVLASDYSQRRYGSGVQNFSDVPGKPMALPSATSKIMRPRLAHPAGMVGERCHARSVRRSSGVRWSVRAVVRPRAIDTPFRKEAWGLVGVHSTRRVHASSVRQLTFPPTAPILSAISLTDEALGPSCIEVQQARSGEDRPLTRLGGTMDRVVLPSRPEENRLFAALPGPRVAKAEILAKCFYKRNSNGL